MTDTPNAPNCPTCPTNRISAMVYLWMSIWDQNTGDAGPLLDLLSPEGFSIHLDTEDTTMTTAAEVKAWFAKFPELVKSDAHNIMSLDIQPDGDFWTTTIAINCPGITANGEPFSVRSEHVWTVVDYGGFLPRISKMNIRLVK